MGAHLASSLGGTKIESDTCAEFVIPKLVEAGWDSAPHAVVEQESCTDGRITVVGKSAYRQPKKRPDYLLRYTRDLTLAVVEAKRENKLPADGLQQAKDYADLLGLHFAYATNGHEIVEYDYFTGLEAMVNGFPSPEDMLQRYVEGRGLASATVDRVTTPGRQVSGKKPRYYQEIAINRAVEAIASGGDRCLLTLATGTGKTFVAFQICWKLWSSRWNRNGAYRRPRILYLADRNILVDDPKDNVFAPFGDARIKIENGEAVKSRDIYFAIYQSLARDETKPGLYREYPPDFFDLVIVDECHRGSANDEGNWREILDYFAPAAQLGMTATPLREDNRNTYEYFGESLYTYSLREGIEDGFLAPYRVHRVTTNIDRDGWKPSAGELDRYGRAIPEEEYTTADFERVVVLRARTQAIAQHFVSFIESSDPYAKSIVFCVDQAHADEMRRAIGNASAERMKQHPDYVCRVTANEGAIGGHCRRKRSSFSSEAKSLGVPHALRHISSVDAVTSPFGTLIAWDALYPSPVLPSSWSDAFQDDPKNR
jgi:type I restriction enzyme R subunit